MQTLAAFGLEPIYHPSGLVRPVVYTDGIPASYSSNIYANQPVFIDTNGRIQVVSTTSSDFVGVFGGVKYTPTNNGRPVIQNNWVAGSQYQAGTLEVSVFVDPAIIYRVQCDGSLAQTSIGDQAYITNPSSGGATTGISQATIGSSLAGVGVQGQVRILGLDPTPDNAFGDAYTVVQVQIARHQYVANKTAI